METTNGSKVSGGMGKKIIFPIVLVLLIGGAAYYAYSKYQYNKTHIDTDNAQIDADISPVIIRIPGYIKDIRVSEFTKVNAGDVLLTIDDSEYQLRVKQAQSGIVASEAQVSIAQTGVGVTEAGSAAAYANIESLRQNLASAQEQINGARIKYDAVQKEYDRFANLLAQEATTQQTFDRIKAERDGAKVALDVAKNQYEVLRKQIQAAEKQANISSKQINTSQSQVAAANTGVAARGVDLDLAKTNLGYTIVKSPISGIVSKKSVQIGQYVQPGTPAFAVVNDSTISVIANFKETQVEKLAAGQKVKIKIDAFPKKELEGVVEGFSPATGAKFSLLPPDNATGNYTKVVQRVPVRIKMNIPVELRSKLVPGMSVHVSVIVG